MDPILRPKQWAPSKEYAEEFSTGKLFDHPGPTFAALKGAYTLFCTVGAHAGLGPLTDHLDIEDQGVSFAPLFATDERAILNAWDHLLVVYMEMLKVFLRMLRESAPASTIGVFENDLIAWRDRVADVMKQRALWIEEPVRKFLG